jgi:hypothetical protein
VCVSFVAGTAGVDPKPTTYRPTQTQFAASVNGFFGCTLNYLTVSSFEMVCELRDSGNSVLYSTTIPQRILGAVPPIGCFDSYLVGVHPVAGVVGVPLTCVAAR